MVRSLALSVLLLLALATIGPSRACGDDGVMEINQAGALAGGITPEDAPGFPVTLDRAGSYRLTSNLDYASYPDHGGLWIRASGVVLDLNGFTIRGPVTCSSAASEPWVSTCSNGASGASIAIDEGLRVYPTIRNGTIAGSSGTGVFCRSGCVLEDLLVRESETRGVFVAQGTIRRVRSFHNGGPGFVIYQSAAKEIQAEGNAGFGIFGNGSSIADAGSYNNASAGIRIQNTIVTGSVSYGNEVGLTGNGASRVRENVLLGNRGDSLTTTNGPLPGSDDTNLCDDGPC